MTSDPEDDDVVAFATSDFPIGHHAVIAVDAMDLLGSLQVLTESLLRMKPALAVIPIDDDRFMQMVSLDDGGLRLESSSSAAVLAANIGFTELVEEHPHIAAATIPAEWKGREMMAAESLLRVATDIHRITFPTVVDVRVFLRQD